jgi:hypothetical protein
VPQPTAATCGNYVALQIKPRASTATTTWGLQIFDLRVIGRSIHLYMPPCDVQSPRALTGKLICKCNLSGWYATSSPPSAAWEKLAGSLWLFRRSSPSFVIGQRAESKKKNIDAVSISSEVRHQPVLSRLASGSKPDILPLPPEQLLGITPHLCDLYRCGQLARFAIDEAPRRIGWSDFRSAVSNRISSLRAQ